MKIKEGFVLRNMGGQAVVVSIGSASKVFNGMVKLNETGEYLWGKISDGASRNDLINSLLEKYDVDIAGIQEVDKNTSRNNYDMLEVFKGDVYGNIFFSKAIDYAGGEYGIGTVSKALLNDGSTVMLESGGNEQRVYQRNVVELNGHKVAFYNTHLSYENTELRHQQMNTLKAAMDSDPLPYRIAVGDFNADQYKEEFAEILLYIDLQKFLEKTIT